MLSGKVVKIMKTQEREGRIGMHEGMNNNYRERQGYSRGKLYGECIVDIKGQYNR